MGMENTFGNANELINYLVILFTYLFESRAKSH